MALKKETLNRLAALAKVKPEDLEKALKDEKEVDLEITEGLQVFTTEELDQRDKNQKDEGIKVGKEIGIKDVRKAAGFEDGGPKDPAKLVQAIAEKSIKDANIKPDEKVTQLTEQVTLLQKTLGEKDAEVAKANGIAAGVALDRKILTAFPKNRASTLTDDEYLTLIKSSHNFKEQDGAIITEKEGKPLRDPKTQNPLSITDAMTGLFNERKGWLSAGEEKPAEGRGGKDSMPAGGFTKKSEVIKHYEDQGVSMNGQEGQQVVNKLAELKKANPDFDMVN